MINKIRKISRKRNEKNNRGGYRSRFYLILSLFLLASVANISSTAFAATNSITLHKGSMTDVPAQTLNVLKPLDLKDAVITSDNGCFYTKTTLKSSDYLNQDVYQVLVHHEQSLGNLTLTWKKAAVDSNNQTCDITLKFSNFNYPDGRPSEDSPIITAYGAGDICFGPNPGTDTTKQYKYYSFTADAELKFTTQSGAEASGVYLFSFRDLDQVNKDLTQTVEAVTLVDGFVGYSYIPTNSTLDITNNNKTYSGTTSTEATDYTAGFVAPVNATSHFHIEEPGWAYTNLFDNFAKTLTISVQGLGKIVDESGNVLAENTKNIHDGSAIWTSALLGWKANKKLSFIPGKGAKTTLLRIDGNDKQTTTSSWEFKNVQENHSVNIVFGDANIQVILTITGGPATIESNGTKKLVRTDSVWNEETGKLLPSDARTDETTSNDTATVNEIKTYKITVPAGYQIEIFSWNALNDADSITRNLGNEKYSDHTYTYSTPRIIDENSTRNYARLTVYVTPSRYVINFNGNGTNHILYDDKEIEGSMESQSLLYFQSFQLRGNQYVRKGYQFINWKDTKTKTEYENWQQVRNLTDEINGQVTLAAQWKPITYSINFDKNSDTATGSTSSMQMTYDESKKLSTNGFTNSKYTFIGWNTSQDGSGTSYTNKQSVENLSDTQDSTVTLYAQWALKAHNVTFVDGHTNQTISTSSVNDGDSITPPAIPSHSGYTSTGWDRDTSNVTSDMTVTVNYRANKYTVAFDNNDESATGTMPNMSMEYDKSSNLTANAFKLTGHSFINWNTKSDGTGKTYTDKQSVSNLTDKDGDTITLYAQWSTNGYTVVFVDGHDGSTIKRETVKYGGSATAPDAPYHKGYTDSNWDKSFNNVTNDLTVTLKYVPNSYTVNFDRNGGTSGTMQPMDMKYDETKNLTANVFGKTGYTWTGWNTQADGKGTAYQDKQSISNLTDTNNASITLYAQWTPNKYKIQFDKNREDATGITDSISMVYDETKNLTDNGFTSSSSKFSNWNTKADGTGTTYSNKQQVKNLTAAPNDIVTLYAQWSTNKYTVTFIDGKTQQTISSASVSYGGNATAPAKPTHKGYTATTWEGNYQNVTKDETVILNYRPNTYIIDFENNGGTGTMDSESMTYDSAKNLTNNTFTKEGYLFSGWKNKNSSDTYKDGQGVKNLADTDNGIVTLVAQWKPISYTVKYDSNGGTGSMEPQTIKYDESTSLSSSKFTKTGYAFAGWKRDDKDNGKTYSNGENVLNLLSTDGASTTMYAQWKANAYTVTFIDGHDGKTITTDTVSYGETANEPTKPTHEGYTATDWDKPLTNITGDTTITLNYRPNKYTITFNGNGDNISGTTADKSMEYGKDDTLTANGYTRNGYTWAGWTSEASGNGKTYTDKQKVNNLTSEDNGVVTLYAQWKVNKYNVTFVDGKSGETVDRQQIDYGGNAAMPNVPAHTGYTSTGWDKDGTNITGDTTITATYTPITYTVSFDKNGDTASGHMDDQKMTYDEGMNLTKNQFTNAGYKFAGWNTSSNASGKQYTDGQSVINLTDESNGKITLYAQWIENAHVSITYKIETDDNNANSGNTISRSLEDLNPDTGTAKGSKAAASKEYDFIGWYDENGKSMTKDESFIPSKPSSGKWTNAVYTAKFSRKEFKVRFIDKDGKTIKEETVKYGSGATAPDAPTVDGYKFKGWDKDFSNITDNIDVTAQYEKVETSTNVNENTNTNAPDNVNSNTSPTPAQDDNSNQSISNLVQTGIGIGSFVIIAAALSAFAYGYKKKRIH